MVNSLQEPNENSSEPTEHASITTERKTAVKGPISTRKSGVLQFRNSAQSCHWSGIDSSGIVYRSPNLRVSAFEVEMTDNFTHSGDETLIFLGRFEYDGL